MNVWLFLSLMCGLLIVLVLVLFWHPQRSRTKTSTSADRQRTGAVFRDDDRFVSSTHRLSGDKYLTAFHLFK